MTPNQLPTTTRSGGQTVTQSPQTAGQSAANTTQSSSLQPGTATALLNGQGSVPLRPTALPAVTLAPGTVSAPAPTPTAAKPDINWPLLSLPVLLCLIAVLLFWTTRRSGKREN